MPSFDKLKVSPIKDCHFYRVAQWYKIANGDIMVVDPNTPRVVTFDPWPRIIFLEAQGKQTVTEFVFYMASQYEKKIPIELDETILSMIDNVLKTGLIRLSNVPVELDPKHAKPYEKDNG